MSGQLYATPNVSVLAQLAGGGFGAAASYSVGTNILTQGIGIGDVTGDGRNDVVASYGGNRPSSNIAVFAQTTLGTLAAPVSYPSYDIPEPLDVADLDRDGRADVLTVHGGWNAAGVYRGSAGGLGAEELSALPYASHYEPHGLAVGDVNGDLALDAAIADYNHGLVLLYGLVPAPSADLSVSVTASSSKVKPRKPFWFDVRTVNAGPSTSTGVAHRAARRRPDEALGRLESLHAVGHDRELHLPGPRSGQLGHRSCLRNDAVQGCGLRLRERAASPIPTTRTTRPPRPSRSAEAGYSNSRTTASTLLPSGSSRSAA